jgi:hypothetical protein
MNKQEAIITKAKLLDKIKRFVDFSVSANKELSELQKIIDAPEPKTGRVMSVDDLLLGVECFATSLNGQALSIWFNSGEVHKVAISMGLLFHDKASCEQYIVQLKREQELRNKR